MQTFVRRILGFVTQTLALRGTHTVVTVDTSEADEAWWQQQLTELEEAHYAPLIAWWEAEVKATCIKCGEETRAARMWAQDVCEDCCH